MCASASPDRPVVFDTVVINYFLAAGEIRLLAGLFGGALSIPRVVFDPDEADDGREEAMSELRRGLHLHRRRSQEPDSAPDVRARSIEVLPEYEKLPELATSGLLMVVDLSETELGLYARLRDNAHVRQYGRVAGLGPGEAAILSLCHSRAWCPATDDTDAIAVARVLLPGVTPLRIRSLLMLAVDQGAVDAARATAIHERMKSLGFWDREVLSF
jgi:hypothetical protein